MHLLNHQDKLKHAKNKYQEHDTPSETLAPSISPFSLTSFIVAASERFSSVCICSSPVRQPFCSPASATMQYRISNSTLECWFYNLSSICYRKYSQLTILYNLIAYFSLINHCINISWTILLGPCENTRLHPRLRLLSTSLGNLFCCLLLQTTNQTTPHLLKFVVSKQSFCIHKEQREN